jgi:hypothetical protein
MATAYTALWWVPRGHRPSIAEAEERLETLRRLGSTERAFTFREPQPAPNSLSLLTTATDDWLCPA